VSGAKLASPIFIVGTVRSGTTLLAACLGEHPRIRAAAHELSAEWHSLGGVEIGSPEAPCAECTAADGEAITSEVRHRLQHGFERIFARERRRGEEIFLNKNPHLWNKLPFLRAAFPDARLIVASRDVRSTVLSNQMLWMKIAKRRGVRHHLPEDPAACWSLAPPGDDAAWDPERSFPGGSVTVLAEYWLRAYETIAREIGAFDRLLYAHHQTLVEDPEGELNRLVGGLGLEPMSMAGVPRIDPHRNRRWEVLLARREREELEAFLEAQSERVAALERRGITDPGPARG
jgi:hypothetical protein